MKTPLLCFYAFLACAASAQDIETLWQEVATAREKDQPKTAIAALEKIYAASVASEAWDDALAALAEKAILEGRIEEGANAYGAVLKLDAARKDAPEKLKPLLDALSAEWMYGYYSENAWRFSQRGAIADADEGDDIDSWSLPRIVKEVDTRLANVLDKPEIFTLYPASEFTRAFTRKTPGDAYRPTVYDILAWRAIQNYTQPMRGEDGFAATLDMPLLADADTFVAWAGDLPRDASRGAKALRLVASVMTCHKERDDALAFADADFNRIETARHLLQMAHVDAGLLSAAHEKALYAFVAANAENEISSRAIASLAMRLFEKKEYLDALALAEKGRERFPDSPGAKECNNVILNVKEPSLSMRAENVWAWSKPEARPRGVIDVTCRNTPEIWFRLYPNPELLDIKRGADLGHDKLKKFLAKEPAHAWKMEVGNNDHQEVSRPFEIQDEMKPGAYVLVASTREDFLFEQDKNNIAAAAIQVSDLATEIINVEGTHHVRVVHNETGVPIEGVEATCFAYSYQNNKTTETHAKTDADGRCEFQTAAQMNVSFSFAKGDDRIHVGDNYYGGWGRSNERDEGRRVLLMTDRAIYRPGQTVRYKGIYYTANPNTGVYEIRPNAEYTLRLLDPNHKEIASRKERANTFGSFAGSFTLPQDRGTGVMVLQMADGVNSSVSFRVEEYKRPKFEVLFDPMKEEAKLNENVTLNGRAATYSGLPLEQAKVKWSVERVTIYPWWFWRFNPEPPKPLASGEAETDADGTFKIAFIAEPAPGAKPEDSPVFHYTVRAEVIDATGETRSGSQTIKLGFSAIRVSLDIPKWFEADAPHEMTVKLATLNGEPVASTGNAKVCSLRQPERPSRDYEQKDAMKWEAQEDVENVPFKTDETGAVKLPLQLPAGIYRVEVNTQDSQGNPVVEKAVLFVVDPASKTYPVKIPFALTPREETCKVGDTFRVLWGSGYPQAHGVLEIWADNTLLKRVESQPGETQSVMDFEVTEKLRGGFSVRACMVREGRFWEETRRIHVPWDNKELTLNWTHINSKLEPGIKEKWTLTVKDNDANAARAEVVAAMFDASLDAFAPHGWQGFNGFRYESTYIHAKFSMNKINHFPQYMHMSYPGLWGMRYPDWSGRLVDIWRMRYNRQSFGRGGMWLGGAAPASARAMPMAAKAMPMEADAMKGRARAEEGVEFDLDMAFEKADADMSDAQPDPPPAVMRKNLEETAFFIPDLVTDGEGEATFTFTAPEALTGWRVMAFAHDGALRSGSAEARAVTQRKLMITPNLPRFLREGDRIVIPVKITNTGDTPQHGAATLTLVDGMTGKPFNMEGERPREPFDLQPGASCVASWTLDVPDHAAGLWQYAILAQAEETGDGEEGFLPVLSRRVQVTESLAFSVRGGQAKTLEFKRLVESAKDKTLRHLGVQAEMTPNATWNAILALPYLMEYPHECAEQVFHRYYANAVARQVVSENPTIAEVFARWKAAGGKALESPLMKNEHLKAVAIEETPWLCAADNETEQRRNIAVLFDADRLEREQDSALRKLLSKRNASGMWPWFAGGPDNAHITTLIMTGFGRMRHIGVKIPDNEMLKTITAVDNTRLQEDARYKAANKNEIRPLSADDAFYLYGRSFFIKDIPPNANLLALINERMNEAKKDWTNLSRLSRAQLAIALKRFGDPATASEITRSIRENAFVSEEQGMEWRDAARSWWWYERPLEAQAMMIEALLEVDADQASADACALWLLQQKHVQRWPTTVSTANAVYALLLGKGNVSLAPFSEAELSLGGAVVKPDAAEAGTGHFTVRYAPADITPELGKIHVQNPGNALAIGALHWQYLQDIGNLTPSADNNPLTLKRQLFKLEKADGKRVLRPLDDSVKQGDTIITRVEVRVDREMHFVHLKDTRAASLEPDDVLSTYRWQDGVGYFQSTRDTATHFFFDRLPRGSYVFEYASHVFQEGTCNGGFAEIQCMYAPEFNAHSASEVVESKGL
ncbi:MAG: MG2 domain-containing protein [Kiritimatiellaeota bacterium]|nr:MG2 domain-containing protein [Kiritimatiellota bacterium]